MAVEEQVIVVICLKKIGNSHYLQIPMLFVRRQDWKVHDVFEIEADVMSPTYNIKKIGNNSK